MIDFEQVFQGRVLRSPVVTFAFQGHIRSSYPVVSCKIRGSEFSSYEIEVRNQATQKTSHFELLTQNFL